MERWLILLLNFAIAVGADWAQDDTDIWEPILISSFYDDSIERLSSETRRLIKNVLVRAVTDWFSEAFEVRQMKSNILLRRDCATGVKFLKEDLYCKDACAKFTMCGPVPIPEAHLEPCRSCDWSGVNCRTENVKPTGVGYAHFILYVSMYADENCNGKYGGQIVYGGHCQRELDYDRPIAGYLNFCPYLLIDGSAADYKIGLIFHELVHTLVFSKMHFPFFRDEHGVPRTRRTRNGEPLIINGFYVTDTSTIRAVEVQGANETHPVEFVVTPNVLREVRAHFNCSSALGAKLENSGPQSHWDKQLYLNEIMTSSLYDQYTVSRITIALFEDSGWYKAHYNYAQKLEWGWKKGCHFLNNSCRGWLQYTSEQNGNPYPFCNDVSHHKCVNNSQSIGDCTLDNHLFQSSSDPAKSCLIYQATLPTSGRSCQRPQSTPVPNLAMEKYGPQSMCIDLAKPWEVMSGHNSMTQTDWGAGCYQVSCTSTQVMVTIGKQVILCNETDGVKIVNDNSGGVVRSGAINCPSYEDACKGFDCFNRCSSSGNCVNGYCLCNLGYFGHDCSRRYIEGLLTCSNVACQNGASCTDQSYGAQCLCPPGFTGRLCETTLFKDPCLLQNCSGHGLCARRNGGSDWTCLCYQGYQGSRCQKYIDYCLMQGVQCRHGLCSNNSVSPTCICEPGYTGMYCNQTIKSCLRQPCKNGGICEDRGSTDYKCHCPLGYTGKRCKIPEDSCARRPCGNGSSCYNEENGFVCACLEPSCSQEWSAYCSHDHCLNGGTCVWNGLITNCLCPLGTSGEGCTQQTSAMPRFYGSSYIVLSNVNSHRFDLVVNIAFKSDASDGLILHWEGPTSITLGLRNQILEYWITNLNEGGDIERFLIFNDTSLGLTKWYSITIELTTSMNALYINGNMKPSFIALSKPVVLGPLIYLGGHPNISQLSTYYKSGLKGCIAHMEINGVQVRFETARTSHAVLQCTAAEPCRACGDRGTCHYTPQEGYWCECRPGYSGLECEQEFPASSLFFNHSYVSVPLEAMNISNLVISITSLSSSGLILLITSSIIPLGDYISVTMTNGTIAVETRFLSMEGWQLASNQTVKLKTEMTIKVKFRKRFVSLTYDQDEVSRILVNSSSSVSAALQGSVNHIFIGGLPSKPQQGWWSGCVHQILINNVPVQLLDKAKSKNIFPCNVHV